MATDTQADSGPAAEELSLVQKIVGVFTSPGKTFASIDLKPSWVVPLLLVLTVNLVFVFVAYDVLVQESMTQQEQAMIDRDMDPDQIEQAMAQMEKWMPIGIWGATLIVPPLILLIVSGVFLFVGNVVLGGKTSFKKVMSVTAWSWLILSLYGLVVLPLVLAKETMQVNFSLATLMTEEARETFMYQLLMKIDIFYAWWIAVYSIGLAVIYKMKTQKVAIAVGSVYAIYAVVASWISS